MGPKGYPDKSILCTATSSCHKQLDTLIISSLTKEPMSSEKYLRHRNKSEYAVTSLNLKNANKTEKKTKNLKLHAEKSRGERSREKVGVSQSK